MATGGLGFHGHARRDEQNVQTISTLQIKLQFLYSSLSAPSSYPTIPTPIAALYTLRYRAGDLSCSTLSNKDWYICSSLCPDQPSQRRNDHQRSVPKGDKPGTPCVLGAVEGAHQTLTYPPLTRASSCTWIPGVCIPWKSSFYVSLFCTSHLSNLNISVRFRCLQRWWRNRALDVCPSEEITVIIK